MQYNDWFTASNEEYQAMVLAALKESETSLADPSTWISEEEFFAWAEELLDELECHYVARSA